MSLADACIIALLGCCLCLLLWRQTGPGMPRLTSRDADTVGPAFWLAWAERRRTRADRP